MPCAAVAARLDAAAAQLDTTAAPPTTAELEAWTREYYGSARELRIVQKKTMDEALAEYDWFDGDYVLTGPDVAAPPPLSQFAFLS